jgi:HTH-type transcriptional regulator/antitoxin HipB
MFYTEDRISGWKGVSALEQLARSLAQVGNAIRRRRKLLSLSQGQLCERTGLRQATISSLEAGDSAARLSTLLDILMALDLELVIRDRTQGARIEDIF